MELTSLKKELERNRISSGKDKTLKNKINILLKSVPEICTREDWIAYTDSEDLRKEIWKNRMASIFNKKKIVLWSQNPFTLFAKTSFPSRNASPALNLEAAINEYESGLLLIRSLKKMTVIYKIGKLINEKNELFPPNQISLREAGFLKDRDNRDYPCLLLKKTKIELIPDETKGLWLTVNTFGTKPGNYKGKIAIHSPEDKEEIDLNLTIFPVELPSKLPFKFMTFGDDRITTVGLHYPIKVTDREKQRKNYLKDEFEHYANLFLVNFSSLPRPKYDTNGNLSSPLDFRLHDKRVVPVLKNGGKLCYAFNWAWGGSCHYYHFKDFDGPSFKYYKSRNSQMPDFMSPVYKKVYSQFLSAIIDHLKKLGADYNDFYFLFADEPYEDLVEHNIVKLKFLKEIDPKVQTFQTTGAKTTPEEIKKMLPYVDNWFLTRGKYAEYTKSPQTAGAVMFYLNNVPLASIYSMRLAPWLF
ncbi:MAG: hypothetical protein PHV82_04305, partial [Victivallaceae bacterium]|nr:hypothetical protein [Victivallaceae bacterium]